MAITTPAIHSIEMCDMPLSALRHADAYLLDSGIDPLSAFVDPEINRQHRAVAIRWLISLHPFARSCLLRNPSQTEYLDHLVQKIGE